MAYTFYFRRSLLGAGLLGIIAGLLTHCAHSNKVQPQAQLEKRWADLESAVQEQKFEIEQLRFQLEAVHKERKVSEAATPQTLASVPRVKVSAQSRSSGSEDGWWKAEFGSPVPSRRKKEGRLIADSRFEAMPFYHEGLLHLKQGRPERAVESLKKFLEISPGHVYSDRAEYWIAQAYDQMGDTQMALTKLELLENRYPNSLRMPETLLNKAKLYEKLGKTVSARVTLRSLVGRYPNDPLSLEARKQLSLLTTKPRTPIPLMGH